MKNVPNITTWEDHLTAWKTLQSLAISILADVTLPQNENYSEKNIATFMDLFEKVDQNIQNLQHPCPNQIMQKNVIGHMKEVELLIPRLLQVLENEKKNCLETMINLNKININIPEEKEPQSLNTSF
ncbi:hypothetical protein K1X76_02610 [bacterium]|nr:hypothetical protein [bacterium]